MGAYVNVLYTRIVVSVDKCFFEHEEDGTHFLIVGEIEKEIRKNIYIDYKKFS